MEHNKSKILCLWGMIRWFMVVVLFSIGLLHISFRDTTMQGMVFIGVLIGIIALNILFQLQSIAKSRWVEIFQIVLDIVFSTLIVHLTGGLNSFFVWVYLIGVITASLTIPQHGGLIAGLIGSMSLLFLIIMYQNGIIIPTEASDLDIAGSTVYILSYTGLFCSVAMIANYLNDQIISHKALSKELDVAKAELVECSQLKSEVKDLMPILNNIAFLDHDINTPLCVITLSLGRVNRYANEHNVEALHKTNNEIIDAVNKIGIIMQRLQALQTHPLLTLESDNEYMRQTPVHTRSSSDIAHSLPSKQGKA